VIVEDVLGGDELAQLVEELDGLEAGVDEMLAGLENERFTIAERGAITFTIHAVLRSPAARAFSCNPTLTGIAADLLGPDVNLYWDQAVYKKPEKPRRFPWHQDTGYTFVEPQHYMTFWVALSDATMENGCPRILPGAHRSGTLLHRWVEPIGWECFGSEPVAAPAPAELRAGSMVAFSSLTPHFTGPNLTDEVRKGYIVQYATEGTLRVEGDWLNGQPPSGRLACDEPDRQYPVVRGGRPVPAS
jgi:phytanoyl-CoA hydroxylase